jgi:hypothetical protein
MSCCDIPKKVIYTIQVLGDEDHSSGLSYKYKVFNLPEGAGYDEDTGEVWITKDTPKGKYQISYNVTAYIEENSLRPGRATTTAAAEWSAGSNLTWDFEVTENVIDLIKAHTEDIFLDFTNIILCTGGCVQDDAYRKIEELTNPNAPLNGVLNNNFVLHQAGSGEDWIKWVYQDCDYGVYYQRDFSADENATNGGSCECAGPNVTNSVHHAKLWAELKFDPDYEFDIQKDDCTPPQTCRYTGAFIFKAAYDAGDSHEFGNLFYAEYLVGDPMTQLTDKAIDNLNSTCAVGSDGDAQIVGVSGECAVGFEGCDGNLTNSECIFDTPTAMPTCTITATASASRTASATASATKSATLTPSASASEAVEEECIALFGLPVCPHEDPYTINHFALLLDKANANTSYTSLVGNTTLEIGSSSEGSGCYNGETYYHGGITEVPLIFIDDSNQPQYCDDSINNDFLRDRGVNRVGLLPIHQQMYDQVRSVGSKSIFDDLADYDSTFQSYTDCHECLHGVTETATATVSLTAPDNQVALVGLKACPVSNVGNISFLLNGTYATDNFVDTIGNNVIKISGDCYDGQFHVDEPWTDFPLITYNQNSPSSPQYADSAPNNSVERDMGRNSAGLIPFHQYIWDTLNNHTTHNDLSEVDPNLTTHDDCEDCEGATPSPGTATATISPTPSASEGCCEPVLFDDFDTNQFSFPRDPLTGDYQEGSVPPASPMGTGQVLKASFHLERCWTLKQNLDFSALITQAGNGDWGWLDQTFEFQAVAPLSPWKKAQLVWSSIMDTGNPPHPYNMIGGGQNFLPASSDYWVECYCCQTDTATASATISATLSATDSVTPTVSISKSPTPSATGPTVSATATPSATLVSVTPTLSITASPSVTGTGSATPSETASGTSTETASATASASAHRTVTASATESITPSASESVTPSASFTRTASASPSASVSHTISATASELTETATKTGTASATATESATLSATATLSQTASFTPTASITESPTSSATGFITASFTASATESSDITPTPSQTQTASHTASNPYTVTHTASETACAIDDTCDYSVEASLGWSGISDLDIYLKTYDGCDEATKTVWYGNTSAQGNKIGGGQWEIKLNHDAHAGCSNTPESPEKVTSTSCKHFNDNRKFRVWFNQHSNCSDEVDLSTITQLFKITNHHPTNDILVNGNIVISANGGTYEVSSIAWAGYDNGAQDSYAAGDRYIISSCQSCPTDTATASITETPTPTATISATPSASRDWKTGTASATDVYSGAQSQLCQCKTGNTKVYAGELCEDSGAGNNPTGGTHYICIINGLADNFVTSNEGGYFTVQNCETEEYECMWVEDDTDYSATHDAEWVFTGQVDANGDCDSCGDGGGCDSSCGPAWSSGSDYTLGDLVCYQDVCYLCDDMSGCPAVCGSPADDTCAVWVIDGN